MVYDNGCTLTNFKCGTNMKFVILEIIDGGNCIQICSCADDEYIGIDGECIKQSETSEYPRILESSNNISDYQNMINGNSPD